LAKGGAKHSLDSVERIAEAVTLFLGLIEGKLLLVLGMTGAALVATIGSINGGTNAHKFRLVRNRAPRDGLVEYCFVNDRVAARGCV
jgi:hypothetical protein